MDDALYVMKASGFANEGEAMLYTVEHELKNCSVIPFMEYALAHGYDMPS